MDKYLKSNWWMFLVIIFLISRIIMYYQFNIANAVILHDHGTFSSAMCKWDCKWYLTIINSGYDEHIRATPHIWRGLANWAFFPLYPNLVALASKLTTLDAVTAGILLNQLLVFIAAIYFYRLLRLSFNDLNSRFGAILLIFSPFSVYFASLYTEGLFLVLSIAGFYYLKTNRGVTAAILGGLLSATRPVGVMLIVPIIVNYLRRKKTLTQLALALSLAVSGLFCYMLFLYFRTGDALAFQHIQKAWGRNGWDLQHLDHQLWSMLSDWHNSIIFILSLLLSVYLLFKKFYEEACFNLACILPGAITGTMMSEGRFCGNLFTFYFALVVVAQRSWTVKIVFFFFSVVLYMSYYIYWVGHANFLI